MLVGEGGTGLSADAHSDPMLAMILASLGHMMKKKEDNGTKTTEDQKALPVSGAGSSAEGASAKKENPEDIDNGKKPKKKVSFKKRPAKGKGSKRGF